MKRMVDISEDDVMGVLLKMRSSLGAQRARLRYTTALLRDNPVSFSHPLFTMPAYSEVGLII